MLSYSSLILNETKSFTDRIQTVTQVMVTTVKTCLTKLETMLKPTVIGQCRDWHQHWYLNKPHNKIAANALNRTNNQKHGYPQCTSHTEGHTPAPPFSYKTKHTKLSLLHLLTV